MAKKFVLTQNTCRKIVERGTVEPIDLRQKNKKNTRKETPQKTGHFIGIVTGTSQDAEYIVTLNFGTDHEKFYEVYSPFGRCEIGDRVAFQWNPRENHYDIIAGDC